MSIFKNYFRQASRVFFRQAILIGCVGFVSLGGNEADAATGDSARASNLTELRITDKINFPLPPGQWEVVQKEDVKLCDTSAGIKCRQPSDGRVFVLANRELNNPIVGIVFRHSYMPVSKGWTNRWCYGQSGPLADEFDTSPNHLLNICTYALNPSGLKSDPTWTVLGEGLTQFGDDIYSLQLLDTLVHRMNARYFRVQVFLRRQTPDLTGTLDDSLIKGWNRAYISAASESLLNNARVQNMSEFALKYAPVNRADFDFEGAVGTASGPKTSPAEKKIKELRATLEIVRDIQGEQSDLYQQLSAEIKSAESSLVSNSSKIYSDAINKPPPNTEPTVVDQALATAQPDSAALLILGQREEQEKLRLAQIAQAAEEAEKREQQQIAARQREEQEKLRLAQIAQAAEEAEKREQLARARESERIRKRENLQKVQSIEDQLKRLQSALASLKSQRSEEASATTAAPSPPVAKARYALIIGNASYKNVGALNNSVKDAEAFADALTGVGFRVSLHRDLGRMPLKKAVEDFRNEVPNGAEVVFYYAGHGVQFGVENYLLPVDVTAQSAKAVTENSIGLSEVLGGLADKNLKFTLAVIDACRDNPFQSVGEKYAARGVKVPKEIEQTMAATGVVPNNTAGVGQMVIYSASAGQQALDSLGPDDPDPNGLFTRIFLKEMLQPDVTIDRIVRQVKKDVARLAKSVNHNQVPALYDQTVAEFYFTQE